MERAIENIVVRVDSGPVIGAGHFMRMIALGEILIKSGHAVHFLTKTENPYLLGLLRNRKIHTHDLKKIKQESKSEFDILVNFSHSINANCIVLDGDVASSDQERLLKSLGYRLIRVCDIPEMHHYADLIICPNYGFEISRFSVEDYSFVATGPRYALLRKEIATLLPNKRQIINNNRPSIIISLGGSNFHTRSLIPEISRVIDLLSSSFNFEFITNIDDEEYPRKLINADLGIFSTGSSMWDAARLGLPFFTISLNDRQRDYAELLRNDQIIKDTFYLSEVAAEKMVLTIERYFESSGNQIRSKLQRNLLALEVGSLAALTLSNFFEGGQ